MLEREWISISDPDEPHEHYVFDVSFLLSSYTCIYGQGCPGIGAEPDPVRACCTLGAHYIDEEDRANVEAMVDVLGPEYLEHHASASRGGVSRRTAEGDVRTRIVDGACIFQNRGGWKRGPGCALHQYAIEQGEHHMTYKPEVCWLVPLRREVLEGVADDGEAMVTTTISSYDRGAWGPGGADFGWWCTDSTEAYVGTTPVYQSMRAELTAMSSPAVYDELAGYLADRRARARTPLPFPVFVRHTP
jgi:hypothetical protein